MERLSLWKDVLWWGWYRMVIIVWFLVSAYDTLESQVLFESKLPVVRDFVSWWDWRLWLIIFLAVTLIALLEGTYRKIKRLKEQYDVELKTEQNLRKTLEGKFKDATKSKDNLRIGAKKSEIKTFGFYDKAQDDGSLKGDKTEGNKLLEIDIILSPLKPMTLDILALELWGKKFYAEKLPETTIKETSNYMMLFIVPKELAIDTKEARIYALAGNSEWYSEPFPIKFGG